MLLVLVLVIIYLPFIYCIDGPGYRYGCPDSMKYCACNILPVTSGYTVTVTCNNFVNELDFKNDLNELTNFEIDELIISGYGSYKLPEQTFVMNEGSPRSLIKKISIKDSPSLTYLGYTSGNQTFFDGLGISLETIYVENCNNIRDSEWIRVSKSLTTQSVLKTLIFYKNELQIHSFNNFNSLPNIEYIYMRQNKLNFISADLTKFINLKVLDLSGNQLIDFELKGSSQHLTSIYLRNNNIKIIKQSILDTLSSPMLIDFTGNPLSCYCDDVGFIVENPGIAQIFRGKCGSPPSLADEPLGQCELKKRLWSHITNSRRNFTKIVGS